MFLVDYSIFVFNKTYVIASLIALCTRKTIRVSNWPMQFCISYSITSQYNARPGKEGKNGIQINNSHLIVS